MLHAATLPDTTGLAAYQASVDTAEDQACAEDSAITAMMTNRRFINEWQCDTGDDVATFLANIMSNMLPRNDATELDDRLYLSLSDQLDALRAQFEGWARRKPSANSKSPLEKYMERSEPYEFDWEMN